MVTLIAGKKGSGKTKDIVKKANDDLLASKGNMIFIDDDNRAMYDLHHDIRFINLGEFPISNSCEFLGFICGLISNNYDIEKIYVDGIMNTVKISEAEISEWFAKIDDISNAFSIDFIITLNYETEIPEKLHRFLN
ncbi:twitching motility protein PilT [Fusibacter bizertensis]